MDLATKGNVFALKDGKREVSDIISIIITLLHTRVTILEIEPSTMRNQCRITALSCDNAIVQAIRHNVTTTYVYCQTVLIN